MTGFDVAAYVPRVLLARPPGAPRHWSEDGSLMFADISGFTRLSDQLARRGHEGAEDLISTLVRIFTMLLSASDDGGDLMKFGGDAMAIHYAGPEHERRACHAAYTMQRIMKVIGRVELTGARTRLQMSIGVHSGRIDFLLPGADHQDLVVTGPGVSETLALESAADAGEILVSPTTAAALPDHHVGMGKGPGLLLRRVGAVTSTGSQILFRSYEQDQVWRHLPTVFRDRPDLLTAGSDHRRATMAFVQVTGLDAQVESDPDGVLSRMDDLATVVGEACAEAGVTVLDTDVAKNGYKYFLAAGAPVTVEDSEGRMMRALRRITTADVGLEVRAGCAAGRVFAGTVGAPFRCTYAAMGDTTNLAARLCGKAAPGEVVAHAPMLARSVTQFDHGPLTELALKGKPEPVPVVRVGDVVGQRGRTGADVPFVGREAELQAMATAYDGVAAGDGAVVEVIGEPGLGKTRLAESALARLGRPVLVIGADPYGALVPYKTLRTLLRVLLGLTLDAAPEEVATRLQEVASRRTPDLVAWPALVAPVVGATSPAGDTSHIDDLDERFRQAKLAEAVRDLLTELMPEPRALLLDDAQWVDESSAEVLAFALSDLRGRPWAVALTHRGGDGGLHGGESLATVPVRMAPLDPADAQRLVGEQALGLRPDELSAVLSRGGGNPYFLLQLADTEPGAVLPETIEELVGARIDGLDATERELLRDAAVLGTRFRAELYERATGDLGFREAIGSSTLAAYLRHDPDGTVVFLRDIHREVAYGQLSFRQRRQLHLKVASAIEAEPRLAGDARLPMLSLHYYEARLWQRAHQASLDAGDQAKAAWANEEAVQFYRRAYDAGRRAGVTAHDLRALGESIGDVLQVSGRFDEAATAYRQSLRASADPGDRIRLMLKVGRMLDHEGNFVAAGRLYRRARLLAADPLVDDPVVPAEIDVADASSRHLRGRNAEGRDLALRAWQVTERLAAIDGLAATERVKRIRARAAFMHDTCAGFVDGPRGVRFGDMPLRMFEEIGDHYYAGIVANNLGISAFDSGRWEDAAELYSRGGDYSRRAGDLVGQAIMDMNLGEILGLQGRFDRARELIESARRTFAVHRADYWLAFSCAVLADVVLVSGDRSLARQLLTEARVLHARLGPSHAADDAAVKELDLFLEEGDLESLVTAAEALLPRRQALGPVLESRTRRALGAAHLRYGDRDRAVAELRIALSLAERMESHHDVARAELLLADSGVPDADARRLRAEQVHRDLGVMVQEGQGV